MVKQVNVRYINIVKLLPIKSERGYIGLAIIVFLILLSAIVFPFKFPPKPTTSNCLAGEAPEGVEYLTGKPAVKDMEVYGGSDVNVPNIGGPDPDVTTDFILLRKNVPVTAKDYLHKSWVILGGNTIGTTSHTLLVDPFPEKPGYDVYYPLTWGELEPTEGMLQSNFSKPKFILRMQGLIFLVNNDPATTKPLGENTLVLADVYQDVRVYNDKTKGYESENIFVCVEDSPETHFLSIDNSAKVIVPDQAKSQARDQLQLEWFILQQKGIWALHCKPAVYLYPPEKKLVNVKVFPKGELGFTDPLYDPVKGWTVQAFPDGHLIIPNSQLPSAKSRASLISNSQYDYLYYESKLFDSEIKKPSRGWVVRYDELENLYNKVLPKLGLNKKEAKDFSEYWLKTLPKSPYYLVGLIDKPQRDYLEALEVTPKPETSIRFSLYFEALDQPKVVEEPQIQTPARKGFTLVDWGGMVKLHPGTPFTCSQ